MSKSNPIMKANPASLLKLQRQFETGLIEAVSLPRVMPNDAPFIYRHNAFGFELMSVEPTEIDLLEDDELLEGKAGYSISGRDYQGSNPVSIMVLLSHGKGRNEIMVIENQGFLGTLRVVNKGNIDQDDNEDLLWIEKVVNGLFAEWAEARRSQELASVETVGYSPQEEMLCKQLREFDDRRPQREHTALVEKLLKMTPPENWPKDVFERTTITRKLIQIGDF